MKVKESQSQKRGECMRISDEIEKFIKEMLNQEDEVEIQRNELAHQFNCVPSQINYVISTRFKPTQGYYVESRRGGGGSIIIRKKLLSDEDLFVHFVNEIGESLSQQDAEIIISDLLSYQLLDEEQARLLKVATNDKVLNLPRDIKDQVRSRIFKNMLINMDYRF
mgnify:CR=1 FL=1